MKGYRYAQWVVKVSDYNEYRPLSEEEHKLFLDIVEELYHSTPSSIIEYEGLVAEFRAGEISAEEFLEGHDRINGGPF